MVQVLDPLHSGSASGSYADITHQRCRGRHIVRARAGPTDNTSAARTQQRGLVALAANAWGALTDDQRSLWRQSASSRPRYDPFGKAIIQSGYHLFMSQAIIRYRLFLAPLSSPRDDIPDPDPHLCAAFYDHNLLGWIVEWQWAVAPPDFEGYSEVWTARVVSAGATPLLTAAQFHTRTDWATLAVNHSAAVAGVYHAWSRSVDARTGRASHFIRATGTRTIT